MPERKPCYLKAVVIVHGKSEKQICDYVKSNLRLKIEVISDKKGEKSIQINGLKNILTDRRFLTFEQFIRFFDDVELIKDKTKKKLSPDFRIFMIMDTDDCSNEQKNSFISKKMFQSHWAYDYIIPVFNTPDLESVLVKAGIKFEKRGLDRKKEYIRIFPTDKKHSCCEGVELRDFARNLEKVKDTNLYEFVRFCLKESSL